MNAWAQPGLLAKARARDILVRDLTYRRAMTGITLTRGVCSYCIIGLLPFVPLANCVDAYQSYIRSIMYQLLSAVAAGLPYFALLCPTYATLLPQRRCAGCPELGWNIFTIDLDRFQG
ncbi:hypothetical protein V8C26DRAFT_243957 [Trichoderma gracile]